MVNVTFPVTLEESYEQFELIRSGAGEWRPFEARGIKNKVTGEVKPMDMGSMKLPFVVKTRIGRNGRVLQPLYVFTYLTYRAGVGKKPPAARNWSYVPYTGLTPRVFNLYESIFSRPMNHFICKLYRAPKDLNNKNIVKEEEETKEEKNTTSNGGGNDNKKDDDDEEEEKKTKTVKKKAIKKKKKKENKSDSIGWHQDNGGKREFKSLHPDSGFEDYVLGSRTSKPRWLQVYDPTKSTTYNLLTPSGTLIVFTSQANRICWHSVPKDTRDDVGERISIVGRHMVTWYDWETRKVYDEVFLFFSFLFFLQKKKNSFYLFFCNKLGRK